MPPSQFERAFASEANVITVGNLELPSGYIAVCDPHFCADARPYTRSVPPGAYDVQLCRVTSSEWGERIALARLLVRPSETVASFELAKRGPGDSGEFLVSSGIASYLDESTRVAFAEVLARHYRKYPEGNYYTDVLAAEFKKSVVDHADPFDAGQWNMHHLAGTSLNVAMFASGLGDGTYKSWWGLTRSGAIVSLVTDFGLL